MARTVLPYLVCSAIALLATACPTVKKWVGNAQSQCIAFCTIDTDESCNGRRPGEYDSCVEKCKSPTPYMCRETQDELQACQSTLTCEEYRDYDARRRACTSEWRAHEECTRRLDGPK